MTGVIRTWAMVSLMVACATAASAGVRAQAAGAPPRAGQTPAPGPAGQISPADIQAMFDAMTVMDAERFLSLTSDQFPPFVQRLKKLQEARVLHTRRRNRAMNELRQLANPQNGTGDDAAIDGKLKELAAIDTEGRAAMAAALDGVDQLLTPRQRARFRLLEDNIDRKKLDFLTRVRQSAGRGGK